MLNKYNNLPAFMHLQLHLEKISQGKRLPFSHTPYLSLCHSLWLSPFCYELSLLLPISVFSHTNF